MYIYIHDKYHGFNGVLVSVPEHEAERFWQKKVFLVGRSPPPAGSMLDGDTYIQGDETEIALNPEPSKKH